MSTAIIWLVLVAVAVALFLGTILVQHLWERSGRREEERIKRSAARRTEQIDSHYREALREMNNKAGQSWRNLTL